MNFIENYLEPSKLLLTWQAIDEPTRRRHVVGKLVKEEGKVRLTYITEGNDYESAIRHGFQGYPAFRKTDREYVDGVLETFMKRLPPRSRGDFNKYLELFRVSSNANISDFALLGYTEAKLVGDSFSIINPFEDVNSPCELLTEIAGYRHYKNAISPQELIIGDTVELKPEPQNEHDHNAVAIYYQNKLIGYINRTQTKAFHRWMEHGEVIAKIERINGREERPLIYLFVKVAPAL